MVKLQVFMVGVFCWQMSCTPNDNDLRKQSADRVESTRTIKENVMVEFALHSDTTSDRHRVCSKDSVYFIFRNGFNQDTITFDRVGTYNDIVYESRTFVVPKDAIIHFSIPSSTQGFFRVGINGHSRFIGRIADTVFNSVRFDLMPFLQVKQSRVQSTPVFDKERTLVVTYGNCAWLIGQEPDYMERRTGPHAELP